MRVIWMTMDNGHDHGGPAITWNEIAPGVFEVRDARFFGGMHGTWEIKVEIFSLLAQTLFGELL